VVLDVAGGGGGRCLKSKNPSFFTSATSLRSVFVNPKATHCDAQKTPTHWCGDDEAVRDFHLLEQGDLAVGGPTASRRRVEARRVGSSQSRQRPVPGPSGVSTLLGRDLESSPET